MDCCSFFQLITLLSVSVSTELDIANAIVEMTTAAATGYAVLTNNLLLVFGLVVSSKPNQIKLLNLV